MHCLREDYVENLVVAHKSSNTDSEYWTDERIRQSKRYQYDVYLLAKSIASDSGFRRVIDLGCGVATKLNLFFPDPFSVVGVDTAEAVRKCKALYRRGTFFEDDFELPSAVLHEAIGQADLIICSDVLEHLSNPSNLMRAIRESTRKTSKIILSTPSREELVGPDAVAPSNVEHCREWSMSEFRRFVEQFGIQVDQHLLQRPFRFGIDESTVAYLLNRIKRRLSLTTTQVVVCQLR
jgi:SAM-dependent methyltransferase